MKICSVLDCDNKAVARGYCNKHWKRWRTYGTPTPDITGRMRGAPIEDKLVEYSMPVTESGCHLWLKRVNHAGYGQLYFRGDVWLAHRVSWTVWRGEIPDGLHVLHKCDTPACINPDHLFVGTNYDNVMDKVQKGRAKGLAGDANPRSRLSDEDVAVLRRCSNTPEEIAALCGMSPAYIARVMRGTARKDVEWR